jgi:hypothetical protein
MQQIYRTQYDNFIRAEHVWKLQINTFINAHGKPVFLFNVPSSESLRIMWPSAGFKLVSPD